MHLKDSKQIHVFQFIDLCILLGCDYTDSIKGIGPKKAIALITEHKSIENILEHIDKSKYPPPENWNFKEARRLFKEPEVADPETVDVSVCWLLIFNNNVKI